MILWTRALYVYYQIIPGSLKVYLAELPQTIDLYFRLLDWNEEMRKFCIIFMKFAFSEWTV